MVVLGSKCCLETIKSQYKNWACLQGFLCRQCHNNSVGWVLSPCSFRVRKQSKVPCPGPHSQQEVKMGFEPRSLCAEPVHLATMPEEASHFCQSYGAVYSCQDSGPCCSFPCLLLWDKGQNKSFPNVPPTYFPSGRGWCHPTLAHRLLFSVRCILVKSTTDVFIRHLRCATLQLVLHSQDLLTAKEVGITAPNLQVRKWRLREVNDLATINS